MCKLQFMLDLRQNFQLDLRRNFQLDLRRNFQLDLRRNFDFEIIVKNCETRERNGRSLVIIRDTVAY